MASQYVIASICNEINKYMSAKLLMGKISKVKDILAPPNTYIG